MLNIETHPIRSHGTDDQKTTADEFVTEHLRGM